MVNFYKEIYSSITKSGITTAKDVLFPKQCLSCNQWGLYFCQSCTKTIEQVKQQRCIVCQKTSSGGYTHTLCSTQNTPDRLISIFNYKDKLINRAINTAKLGLVSEIFTELSGIATTHFGFPRKEFNDFVLCPIPITARKHRFRGFNQSRIITQTIANQFDLAIDSILVKRKTTKQQKDLNKTQRKLNLLGSFSVELPQSLPSKVLLIDDITTTGSTFIEAAKALKNHGVDKVWCLALAQD